MNIDGVLQSVVSTGLDLANQYMRRSVDQINIGVARRISDAINRELRRIFPDQSRIDTLRELRSRSIQYEISLDHEETVRLLTNHFESQKRWFNTVQFQEMRGTRKLSEIYIDIDVLLMPSRLHLDQIEKSKKIPFSHVASELDSNLLITGLPGAGKTTAMKRLLSSFYSDPDPDSDLAPFTFAWLVRLHELDCDPASKQPVLDTLLKCVSYQATANISDELSKEVDGLQSELQQVLNETLTRLIDEFRPLIILDGFDEISNLELKNTVFEELSRLDREFNFARFILTSRTGELPRSIRNVREFEIAPLSAEQIEKFASRWIPDADERQGFLSQIAESPYRDTAMKPLALAYLCAIFQRIK